LIQQPIKENNMSTTMFFSRTQALQAASIYTQQATDQQTGGIDISTMMKMMGSSLGKKKQVKAAESKSANPRAKKAIAG
jgi:hypothetical protein